MRIDKLKKMDNDLGQIARLLNFEGSLLCSETHIHVCLDNLEFFSVEWVDKWWMGGDCNFRTTGIDHQATAQAILRELGDTNA